MPELTKYSSQPYRSEGEELEEASFGACMGVNDGQGSEVGEAILKEGGNAASAAVGAALAAAITAPHACGLGGYGGHLIISEPGKRPEVVQFNCRAPKALDLSPYREEIPDAGWETVAVPGVLAGLQYLHEKHGNLPLERCLAGAIHYARDGYPIDRRLEYYLQESGARVRELASGSELITPDNGILRNEAAATLLERLAQEDSLAAIYREPMAGELVELLRARGSQITIDDLTSYSARSQGPLHLEIDRFRVHTPSFPAGGVTVLQALHALSYVDVTRLSPLEKIHAKVEALRLAWNDRLRLIGDEKDRICDTMAALMLPPVAEKYGAFIQEAVREKKSVSLTFEPPEQPGTVHYSVTDKDGMMVSMTLTMGDSFGAKVALPEWGIFFGNGMTRFDPIEKEGPNALGAGKEPLTNMCPVYIENGDRRYIIGGEGGRKIPDAVFETVFSIVFEKKSLVDAVKSPRIHIVDNGSLSVEEALGEAAIAYLRETGYSVEIGEPAHLATNGIEGDRLVAAQR